MEFDAVFEGGGAKGIAFVGALEPFLERHHFGRLVGTSAGAIVATFLAAGYSAQELQEALGEEIDGKAVFSYFLSPPSFVPLPRNRSAFYRLVHRVLYALPYYRKFASLMLQGGIYSAAEFEAWLECKLDRPMTEKWNMKDLRLGELHALTGKHLTLIAADTTANQMLILNHNTAPRCPVIQAVRMSMSLPFVWQEISWQQDWGGYLGVSITGHRIVDGGILSAFPIELLLSTDSYIMDKMAPASDNPTLGFLLDETLPVPNAPPTDRRYNLIGSLFGQGFSGRFLDLIDTMTKAHDKIVLDSYRDAVVNLPTKGYGTTDFDMSTARRDALVAAGRAAMVEYFEQMGFLEAREADQGYHVEGTKSLREQQQIDAIARRMFGLPPL